MPLLPVFFVTSTGEAAAIAEPLVVVRAKLLSAPLVGETLNESPAYIVPVIEKFMPSIGCDRLLVDASTVPVWLSVSV